MGFDTEPDLFYNSETGRENQLYIKLNRLRECDCSIGGWVGVLLAGTHRDQLHRSVWSPSKEPLSLPWHTDNRENEVENPEELFQVKHAAAAAAAAAAASSCAYLFAAAALGCLHKINSG